MIAGSSLMSAHALLFGNFSLLLRVIVAAAIMGLGVALPLWMLLRAYNARIVVSGTDIACYNFLGQVRLKSDLASVSAFRERKWARYVSRCHHYKLITDHGSVHVASTISNFEELGRLLDPKFVRPW
jgi:hypothetical protein